MLFQVKIFSSGNQFTLEEQINQWMLLTPIKKIQHLQVQALPSKPGMDAPLQFFACVIYVPSDDEKNKLIQEYQMTAASEDLAIRQALSG